MSILLLLDDAGAPPAAPTLGWFVKGQAIVPAALPDFVFGVLDPRGFLVAPVVLRVQGLAVPPPSITTAVLPGRDPRGFQVAPTVVYVRSVAIPPPPPQTAQFVAQDPRLFPAPTVLGIQGQALPPPPSPDQIWVALQAGNPPPQLNVTTALYVQASAVIPARAATQVFVAQDPRQFPLTTPVAIRVAGAALPPPAPSSLVVPGRDPRRFLVAPVVLPVQGSRLPPPAPSSVVFLAPPQIADAQAPPFPALHRWYILVPALDYRIPGWSQHQFDTFNRYRLYLSSVESSDTYQVYRQR